SRASSAARRRTFAARMAVPRHDARGPQTASRYHLGVVGGARRSAAAGHTRTARGPRPPRHARRPRQCRRAISALFRRYFGAISALFRRYFGAISALFRRYFGAISALFRRYFGPISALFRALFRYLEQHAAAHAVE